MKRILILTLLLAVGGPRPVLAQDRADTRHFQILPHPEDPDLFLGLLWGGFMIRSGGTVIRGERALFGLDRDEWAAAVRAMITTPPLPARSGPVPPRPVLSAPGLQEGGVLLATLLAGGREPGKHEDFLRLFSSPQVQAARWAYIEGGVTLEEQGLRSLEASRLHMDMLDGSFVAENAVLRIPIRSPSGEWTSMVVRAPLITYKCGRIQARQARFTYCDHAVPHYHVAVSLLEGWQEADGWAFEATNTTLRIQEFPIFWMPSLSWRTGEEGPLPLKGASVGRSSKWGQFLFTEWGKSLRRIGSKINNAFGLPGERFKGDWTLSTGISSQRGFPLQLDLKYGIPGLYEGRSSGFILNDQGDRNRGPVRTEYDGSELPDLRWLGTTENRLFLAKKMKLDAQVNWLGDPGVLPEFFESRFKREELPETSLHYSWASQNRQLSILGRAEINGDAYGENRVLAESFVEQIPSAAFTWVGEPLFRLPWGQQVAFSIEGEATRFNRDFSDSLRRDSEEALRTYGDLELSSPFSLGPVCLRPFANFAAARYDQATTGQEGSRGLAAGGLLATLHLSRYYPVNSSFWGVNGLLHQLDPELGYMRRSSVAGDEAVAYPQFDRRDALEEREEVVLALRNRLLTARKVEGEFRPTTVMRADVAASLYPDAERDNLGNSVGLISFEVAWQPHDIFYAAAGTPSFSVEGAYDPNSKDLKTLHLRAALPFEEFLASAGWISGTGYNGTIYGSARVTMLGRWQALFHSSYDLERRRTSGYEASLLRLDHDWTLGLVIRYDEGQDDFQVSIQFLPGGWMVQRRRPTVGGMDPLDSLL